MEYEENGNALLDIIENGNVEVYLAVCREVNLSSKYHTDYCDGRMSLPLMVATLVLGFVTVFVNLGVIIRTVRIIRQGHDKPAFFFIGNLALSDFAVGLYVVIAFLLHVTNKSDLWRQNTCMLQIGVAVTACQETIFTIVLISADKYLYICHGLHYSGIMTRRRVYGALVVSWCLSLLIGSLPAMGLHVTWPEACNRCAFAQVISTPFAIVFFVTSVAVPLGVVVGLYSILLALALRMHKARYGGSYTGKESARSTNFRLSFMSTTKSRSSTTTTTTTTSSKSSRRRERRKALELQKEALARQDVKGRDEGAMLISGSAGVLKGPVSPGGLHGVPGAGGDSGVACGVEEGDGKGGVDRRVSGQDAGPGEHHRIDIRNGGVDGGAGNKPKELPPLPPPLPMDSEATGTREHDTGHTETTHTESEPTNSEATVKTNEESKTEGDLNLEEHPVTLKKQPKQENENQKHEKTSKTNNYEDTVMTNNGRETERDLNLAEHPVTLKKQRIQKNENSKHTESKTNNYEATAKTRNGQETERDLNLAEHPVTLKNQPTTKTERGGNETEEDSTLEEPYGVPEDLLDTDEEEEEEEEEIKGWRSVFPSKYMNKIMTETLDKVMFLKKCRAVKTVLLILISFTATYVPFVVGTLVYSAEEQKRPCLLHLLNTLLYCAVVANSLVNPLIYAYGYREFRLRSERFKGVFARKKKRSYT